MQLKFLGAHQSNSAQIRSMSLLIDGRLAIDAGGLVGALTLEEQLAIDAVLVTHRHYDHVKDLPMLAHNLWEEKSLELYCTQETRRALQDHLFNDIVWPSMSNPPEGYHPVNFTLLRGGHRIELLGYGVLPVEMDHTVPTVGYLVERGGKSLFYTADTGGSGKPPWAGLRPDLLIIETTMGSEHSETAARFKHLTPLSLRGELVSFHARQGYYPRTICVHMNPKHEPAIRNEVSDIAAELGADITLAAEGVAVEV